MTLAHAAQLRYIVRTFLDEHSLQEDASEPETRNARFPATTQSTLNE